MIIVIGLDENSWYSQILPIRVISNVVFANFCQLLHGTNVSRSNFQLF